MKPNSKITRDAMQTANDLVAKHPGYWNIIVFIDPLTLTNKTITSVGVGAALPKVIMQLPNHGIPEMLRAAALEVEGAIEGIGPIDTQEKN